MSQGTEPQTPILVKAALALVAINFAIVLWFGISPTISPSTVKGAPQRFDFLADKGSPFKADRIETRRRSAKLPMKLEPVVAQIIPEATIPVSGSDN